MKLPVNKNLGLLLMGQLVSQVGDKFYLLALSFWVLKTTGSPAKMAIVLASSLFPSLILGFLSGVFIDRYSRKWIIVGTDAIRGLVIGFVAAAYFYGFLTFEIIIVSQVLLSINAAFFDPAIPTVIPQMVEGKDLAKANSMTEFIRGMSTIIGPVLGGIAVASFGYLFAFAFNAASFLVSAFFEGFLKIPPVEKGQVEKASFKRELLDGYKYILSEKKLMVILAMVAVIHFFVGSMEVIIPVLADGLAGEGARNMGFMQTAFGAGAVYEAPRRLLDALGAQRVFGNWTRSLARTSGADDGLWLTYPHLAAGLAAQRLDFAETLGADTLVTDSPLAASFLSKHIGERSIKVKLLAELFS